MDSLKTFNEEKLKEKHESKYYTQDKRNLLIKLLSSLREFYKDKNIESKYPTKFL